MIEHIFFTLKNGGFFYGFKIDEKKIKIINRKIDSKLAGDLFQYLNIMFRLNPVYGPNPTTQQTTIFHINSVILKKSSTLKKKYLYSVLVRFI